MKEARTVSAAVPLYLMLLGMLVMANVAAKILCHS